MTIRNLEKIEKVASNPLEEFFNVESGTTSVVRYERKTDLTEYSDFDDKDKEIESSYQEIADAALSSHEALQDMIDTADTKVVPRLMEVSAQMLNTALAAVSKRASLKENKDRHLARMKAGGPKTVNNTNVVIMDRNDIVKRALEEQNQNVIDVDSVEVKETK